MKISSPVFDHLGNIPPKHTCNGTNINPPLSISDVPRNSVTLVLIMDDPDVPRDLRLDGMWDHWIVFDIPTNMQEIDEGSEPEGVHGIGTANNLDYCGPCPPNGQHRYFFKLYALDCTLDLAEGVSKGDVEKAMEDHIIEKVELIGVYEQK